MSPATLYLPAVTYLVFFTIFHILFIYIIY